MVDDGKLKWWQPSTVLRSYESVASTGANVTVPVSALSFWALMAFTFILLISPQSSIPALAPFRIALLAAVLAVVTYVFDRFVRRQPIVQVTRELWIVILLVGWVILTIPLSHWPGGSVAYLTETYLKTLIVFWLLSHVVNTLPRLRHIAWGLSLMTVPLALGALSQFFSGDALRAGLPPGSVRIAGYDAPLTANPNDLALMLNLILPLSIGLFFSNTQPAARAVLLGLIGLDMVAIVATFSRGGFLTLAVILVAYLGTIRRRGGGGWAFLALVLGLAVVPLFIPGYTERLSTITTISADPTGSSQERWRDMLAALTYMMYHPVVGAGIGMNALAMNEMRGDTGREVHNVYLEYGMELGIPGLILFLLLLTGCLKHVRNVQRQSAQIPALYELSYLSQGIRISLIAFAVAGFFHPVAYHFYFYYIAGLAIATKTIFSAVPDQPISEPTAAALPARTPS